LRTSTGVERFAEVSMIPELQKLIQEHGLAEVLQQLSYLCFELAETREVEVGRLGRMALRARYPRYNEIGKNLSFEASQIKVLEEYIRRSASPPPSVSPNSADESSDTTS